MLLHSAFIILNLVIVLSQTVTIDIGIAAACLPVVCVRCNLNCCTAMERNEMFFVLVSFHSQNCDQLSGDIFID